MNTFMTFIGMAAVLFVEIGLPFSAGVSFVKSNYVGTVILILLGVVGKVYLFKLAQEEDDI